MTAKRFTPKAPPANPMRIDENGRWNRLVLLNGENPSGNWRLARAVGALGMTGVVFAVDAETGCVVPLSAIAMMVPAGSATPQENDEIDAMLKADPPA